MADLDLARRAVAATGWRWKPGMASMDGYRLSQSLTPYKNGIDMRDRQWWGSALPDLDDGATQGWLDALVRERWGDGYEVMPYVTHIGGADGGFDTMPVIWWRLERLSIRGIRVEGLPWVRTLMCVAVRHPQDPAQYLAGPTKVAALVAALEVPRD